MYIMYESDDCFIDCQFGFIKSRGTALAVSVVLNVGTYCIQNGSQMYICSLDVLGRRVRRHSTSSFICQNFECYFLCPGDYCTVGTLTGQLT